MKTIRHRCSSVNGRMESIMSVAATPDLSYPIASSKAAQTKALAR